MKVVRVKRKQIIHMGYRNKYYDVVLPDGVSESDAVEIVEMNHQDLPVADIDYSIKQTEDDGFEIVSTKIIEE